MRLAEYRQFYFTEKDLILTTETDADAFEELMNNLVLRKNEYLIEQDKIAEENKKLKKQAEKQKQEIKQLKTIAKTIPTPTPEQPTIIKREVADKDAFGADSGEELITIKKADYEILKARYGIAKSALEAVLYFIVPQNLRDLVNKAMKDLADADKV